MYVLNFSVLYHVASSGGTQLDPEEDEDPLLSNSDGLLNIPSFDLSDLGDNFSRRFERKSWRERHEQQKKLIKKSFEVSYK